MRHGGNWAEKEQQAGRGTWQEHFVQEGWIESQVDNSFNSKDPLLTKLNIETKAVTVVLRTEPIGEDGGMDLVSSELLTRKKGIFSKIKKES